MRAKEPVNFDLKTIALLREVLDRAWDCVPPTRQAMTSRALLAEGILKSAAKGERDPERLRDAALIALDTYLTQSLVSATAPRGEP